MFFADICIHRKCRVTICFAKSRCRKISRIKKGYRAALLLDACFAVLAFIVIETMHTQISSLFLGKDGTELAYQVSGDYMKWIGYFFIIMGIKMATDGVLRGIGNMRPFLIANMVNLAIRLSVALILRLVSILPLFGLLYRQAGLQTLSFLMWH